VVETQREAISLAEPGLFGNRLRDPDG